MLRNKKSIFSDGSDEEDEDNFHKTRFVDSDNEEEYEEISAQKKYLSKGKRKLGLLASDSENDNSQDDNESSDNFTSKIKNRRGIIEYDSENDDDCSDDESSSSGREEEDGSEKNLCPICLGDFEDQMVGVPEHCEHLFCIECIKEWSKNVNNCPVDRKKFNKITIKDMNGKFIDEIIIEDVKAADVYEDPPTDCQVCGACDREDCMLLCDECDNGYHMDCLTPPLEAVPVDEWFCIECRPTTSTSTTSRTRRRNRAREETVEEEGPRPMIGIESILESVYDRINNSPYVGSSIAERRRLMFGESPRTRTQARTVASIKSTGTGRGRGRGRGGGYGTRGRGCVTRSTSNPNNPPKRTGKQIKRARRQKRKEATKAKKKVAAIQAELAKVRDQGVHDDELPARVRIYGTPYDLDELYDPGNEERESSPVRSTIVDTPDVVGSILGGFSTLNPNRYVVSRDGRGTLIPKESIKKEPMTRKETVTRKRKIRFTKEESGDEDDDDDDGDGNKENKINNAKDEGNKRKKVCIPGEDTEKTIAQTNIKFNEINIKTEVMDSEAEEASTKSEERTTTQRKETKIKTKQKEVKIEETKTTEKITTKTEQRKTETKQTKTEQTKNSTEQVNTRAEQSKIKTEQVKIKTDGMNIKLEETKIKSEQTRTKFHETKIKCEESDEYNDDKSGHESSSRKRDVRFTVAEEESKGKRSELLDNMRKRLKETMKKKAREDALQNECNKMRAASDVIDMKTDSSLLNVASFKIPKLKKKNNDGDTSSNTDQDKDHTDSNRPRMRLLQLFHEDQSELSTHKKDKDSHGKHASQKIDVSPHFHQEGSQKKKLIAVIKKEADITREASVKKRPPLTNLEKKIKLYKDGVLSPDSKKQKVAKPETKNSNSDKHDKHTSRQLHGRDTHRIAHNIKSGPGERPNNEKHRKEVAMETKKKSISLHDYRNRRVIGDSDSDTNVSKNSANTSNSAGSKMSQKIKKTEDNVDNTSKNKTLFGDTDSETNISKNSANTSNGAGGNTSQKIKTTKDNVDNASINKTFFGNTDSETVSTTSSADTCSTKNKTKNNNKDNNIDTNSTNRTKSLLDPRHSATTVADKKCIESKIHVLNKPISSSQSHSSKLLHSDGCSGISKVRSVSGKAEGVKINTNINTDKLYSKYVNPSTKLYNDNASSSFNLSTRCPTSKTSTTLNLNKSVHHISPIYRELISTNDADHNKGTGSKFDENSPYSVIRPFLPASSSSTSHAPVAVVSPSLRDDASETPFKFKETKNNYTTASKPFLTQSRPPSDPRSQRVSSTSNEISNTSNLSSNKNISSSTSVSMNKYNFDTGIEKKREVKYDWSLQSLKKDAKPYDDGKGYISRIKGYLKPYYKKGLVTKEQWKVVVKSAVRVIHSNPTYFSTDEQIRLLVQKHVTPYLKL